MKIAMLFPLVAFVCIAHAQPLVPGVDIEVDDISGPLDPFIQEQLPTDESIRQRRSPGDPQGSRGSVTGGVTKEKGVGTIVHAQGQGNVWTSKDGNSRVDANGEWSKVVRGPARGKPNYNVGATFKHRF